MILPKENRVLYIVGAGFSAPLGLPLMGNFISRSKDLYFNDKEKFGYFQNVYKTIAELSVIKNTFHADLHNIEEILSLLEMEAFMKNEALADEFRCFLADVVKALLPPVEPVSGRAQSSNWYDFIFGENRVWRPYLELMACMLGLELKQASNDPRLVWKAVPSRDRYAVITLNYDTAIETAFNFVTQSFIGMSGALVEKRNYDPSWTRLQLAKLHGCAEEGSIIPPTWRKGSGQAIDAWKLAYNLIKDANQIRIVGYSLPVSDSYVRYLFKSAIRESRDLKHIDVLVSDPGRMLEARYSEFIDSKNFRFKNFSLEDYLDCLSKMLDRAVQKYGEPVARFNQLEAAHNAVFSP